MKKSIDKRDVLDYVSKNVVALYEDMQAYFGVSYSTLYRSCMQLKKEGWADLRKNQVLYMPCCLIPPTSAEDLPLKNRLALCASGLIDEGDVICLAGSSIAVSLMFPFLVRNQKNITIVSNSILVFRNYLNLFEQAQSSNIKLITIGGTIKKTGLSFGGEYVDTITANLNIHKTFVGTEGVDLTRGLFVDQIDSSSIEQKIMAVSNKSYLVTDHSKFFQKKLFKWSDWSALYGLITDYPIPDPSKLNPNLHYYPVKNPL